MSGARSRMPGWPKRWHVVVFAIGMAMSSLATVQATWGESVPIPSTTGGSTGLLVTVEASHDVTVQGKLRSRTTTFERDDGPPDAEWTGSAVFYVPPSVSEITASIGGGCGGCCGGVCPPDGVEPFVRVVAMETVEHWELTTYSDEVTLVPDPIDGASLDGVVEASSRPLMHIDESSSESDLSGGIGLTGLRQGTTTTWDFSVGYITSIHTTPGASVTFAAGATIIGHCPEGTDPCEPPEDAFVGPITVTQSTR